jgi:aryl-alcohol dehydrogenase-like predicted oxidoreductase
MMVWSPLAGGFLSGKYSDGSDSTGGRRSELDFPPIDQSRGAELIPVLREIAARHDRSPAQIALAWLLRHPVVTSVIVGAKRVDQLEENLRATDIELTEADLSALDEVSKLSVEYPNWLLNQPEGRDA